MPGKLTRWIEQPGAPGNLFDVARRSDIVKESQARFAREAPSDGPVIRAYSMSFVNNVLRAARDIDPGLRLDLHSGPGAPPNFTYATFLDDRPNRRPGDIAVLGILSSSVSALASMSNRTWAFEQPAPFTYPVFVPAGDGLRRIEPLVNSAHAERALRNDRRGAAGWTAQLKEYDAFYSVAAFGWPAMDRSPFIRLVRRSFATSTIKRRKTEILHGGDASRFPYMEVLRRIIRSFAKIAREDGQNPIVVIIQTRDLSDPNILAIARPILERHRIPYLATAEHFDPRDPSGFVSDGHYSSDIDAVFGLKFLEVLNSHVLRR